MADSFEMKATDLATSPFHRYRSISRAEAAIETSREWCDTINYTWNATVAARVLAKELEDSWIEAVEEMTPGFLKDLLRLAVPMVRWEDVAREAIDATLTDAGL